MSVIRLLDEQVDKAGTLLRAIRAELRKVLIGQDRIIDEVLVGLLCGAHVLLEGVPGLGKTLLVKALAKTFSGRFARIQFTPDLMPSDVVGHTFFDMGSSQFITREGPVFTHLLLADEINRAPAKTQAALLEVMQEGQVTLEGRSMAVPQPFMVLATQNPLEQEGTYPLPEAQLDRFLLKICIDYPDLEEELALTRQVIERRSGGDLAVEEVAVLIGPEQVAALQRLAAHVAVDDRVLHYAVSISRATREHPRLSFGAGPRGSIALVRAARACALLSGRTYATPDDVKAIALPALRHRVATSPEADIEGSSADTLLRFLLDQVPSPRL
ncbi:ATPase [Methylocaldum marinum]|uniref:ATPase n=1 Tax=Methylocaldum marinum TaxID=1432792 RepID=A0A250L187_9GAMM|nr:MoxR family ATPase [Methylocaldum marinum]BBA35889.1 ATPase [Methylocaldum marinum]